MAAKKLNIRRARDRIDSAQATIFNLADELELGAEDAIRTDLQSANLALMSARSQVDKRALKQGFDETANPAEATA